MRGPQHALEQMEHADVGGADQTPSETSDDDGNEGVLAPTQERKHGVTS
jgi:hypothetical protein